MKLSAMLLFVLGSLLSLPSAAELDLAGSQNQWLPKTQLLEVLNAVSRSSDQVFAIDDHVQATIVLGQLKPKGLSYDDLLLVLRNNGLAALASDGVVNIIPVRRIRQNGLPLFLDDNDTAHGQEWVTRIVKVKHTSATMFVPILRPLLPQPAHMVAHKESNSLLIVARFDNLQRLVAIIRAMDHQEAWQKPPP